MCIIRALELGKDLSRYFLINLTIPWYLTIQTWWQFQPFSRIIFHRWMKNHLILIMSLLLDGRPCTFYLYLSYLWTNDTQFIPSRLVWKWFPLLFLQRGGPSIRMWHKLKPDCSEQCNNCTPQLDDQNFPSITYKFKKLWIVGILILDILLSFKYWNQLDV